MTTILCALLTPPWRPSSSLQSFGWEGAGTAEISWETKLRRKPDLTAHHTTPSTNGEHGCTVLSTTILKFYFPPYISCFYLYNQGTGLLFSRTHWWQGGDLFKLFWCKNDKVNFSKHEECYFLPPPPMNSFELQENSLGTFNEFVGLISPTKGLQEKHFIWKWKWKC